MEYVDYVAKLEPLTVTQRLEFILFYGATFESVTIIGSNSDEMQVSVRRGEQVLTFDVEPTELSYINELINYPWVDHCP